MMKIKQLLFGLLTLSLVLVSCSKEEIIGVDITPKESVEMNQVQENSTTNITARTAAESTLKAYIFIEPRAKHVMVKGYLNTLPSLVSGKRKFVGFHGVNGDAWKFNLPNYISMPHWTDGRLPQIIEAEIPQTSGGIDSYGNPVVAYNFKTAKITKNTVNDNFSWVIVLIPVDAMNGDTKRQRRIQVVQKVGTVTKSSTIYTTDNVLSGTIINYQGNRIPVGQYRVYSTYPSTGMRLILNSTNDVYIRGFSN